MEGRGTYPNSYSPPSLLHIPPSITKQLQKHHGGGSVGVVHSQSYWGRRERQVWVGVLFVGLVMLYAVRMSVPVTIVTIAQEMDWDKRICVSGRGWRKKEERNGRKGRGVSERGTRGLGGGVRERGVGKGGARRERIKRSILLNFTFLTCKALKLHSSLLPLTIPPHLPGHYPLLLLLGLSSDTNRWRPPV